MKTDLYTKTIHTVIALCLVYLVLKDVSTLPDAQAQTPNLSTDNVMENIIRLQEKKAIDVNIVSVAGSNIRDYDVGNVNPALPVKILK